MGVPARDEAKEKALHSFCEEVRLRGKVVCRTAICDDDRKEFFRGKDLLRYCEANPEKLEGLADTKQPIGAQLKEVMTLMLTHQVAIAADRFYKRPHPGRKRLVKYPRKLEPRPRNEQGWDADAFYVWLEDRPMPPWQYALAGLMALVIFALCLFPLAPAWLRSVVVYFFLGLLGGIFALILVRFLLFLVVFAFIGYEFWLFPNLLSDQVDLIGAFVPLLSFEKPADGKSHLGTRVGGFLGVSFMLYVFYVYTPDESSLSFQKTNESILDMFNTANKPGIGPGTGYVPPKFGNDRNVDIEKIQQARLLEIQRRKEEAARNRAAGVKGDAPQEPVVPSFPELFDEEEDSDAEGNASAGNAAGAAEVDAGKASADAAPAASEQRAPAGGVGARGSAGGAEGGEAGASEAKTEL